MTEYPLIPMFAVTGRPTRAELRERLSALRGAKITQLLLYPRSGCELEYMSDAWLDCCETVTEEALSLGFTSLSGLAVAAIVGIALNALLPGKDYVFGRNSKGDTSVDFEVNRVTEE